MPIGHEALGGDRMATASRKSSVASPNLPIDTQDSTRIHMKQHDAPHAWLGRTPRYVRLPTIDQSVLSTCLPSEVRSPARSMYSPLPSLYSVPCRTRNRQCCNSRSKARNASWEAHDAPPRILERTVYGIPATVSYTQQNHMVRDAYIRSCVSYGCFESSPATPTRRAWRGVGIRNHGSARARPTVVQR